MDLYAAWFGYEIHFTTWPPDLHIGPVDEDEDAAPTPRGDSLSYPINFTRPEIPWDADGPVHTFDPDGGEDARA